MYNMNQIFVIISCLILLYIINIFSNWNELIIDSYYNNKQLKIYDIGHKYLPRLNNKYTEWYNLVLYVVIITTLLVYNHLATTFFMLLVIVYLFRLITINLTVVPKRDMCKVTTNFQLNGYCYDNIYSGHAAVLCIGTLLLYDQQIISLVPLILNNMINAFFIITTRSHYTIDVVIAFIVSILIYQNMNVFNIYI